jgi:hypothetical protein
MAAYTPTQLCPTTELTTSAVILYTVPAATSTIIKQVLISNVSGIDARATIHLVPSGGTPVPENKAFGEILVPANTTQLVDGSIVIPTGATVQGLANISDAINVHISGVEVA